MFVGGEFYYDDLWLTPAPTFSFNGMYFLNGGQACLRVIGDYLQERGIEQVLLPEYLCPSIITTLEKSRLRCQFYKINEDLTIHLDDVVQKIDGQQAFYFINYFGFPPSASVCAFIKNLQQYGTLIIEDNAQTGFPPVSMGDFVFNSFRKLVPYDGAYLLSRFNLTTHISRYVGAVNRRLPIMREYRRRLKEYLLEGRGDYEHLTDLYQQAELAYETDEVVLGDHNEKTSIEHLNWQAIRQVRRENYLYLLNLLQSIPELTALFPKLPDNVMPLGLPVYVKPAIRDNVLDALGESGIGLLVHWEEICQYPQTCNNHQAVAMAQRMLTLTIDQRTSHKQLEYLAQKLAGALASF